MKENVIELIPVKIYKKGLLFLVAKTVRDITNHFTTKAKAFSQQSMPQLIPVLPSILEP